MQISLAFIELNTKNIIHRDLKPANILIVNDNEYKLCDFGCSKFIEG
jgi:serine/threonine protein kinase